MAADPADPAIILDVTRLVSRLGQGPLTGIDRVEAAWLAHLQPRPHLLLARIRRRQVLLPPSAGAALLRWVGGDCADLPAPGLLDRLRGRRDARARGETALWRRAVARAGPGGRGLGRAARRALAGAGGAARPIAYLNVGHSNLTARLWRGLAWARRVVLIHDTIPLDHPEWTRAGQSEAFRDRLRAALGQADLVLTISEATRRDVLAWRDRLGVTRPAPVMATPIGTALAEPDPAAIPPGLDLTRPCFVTLGTVEPRKNHAVLLDAWDELARRRPAGDMPVLVVIGRRGWDNRATLARLDALPPDGPVRWFTGLDDGAVAALVAGAWALLMPSRAEGFGLPLTEAAARGVPVLAAPLPVTRELLGTRARYLSPDDPVAWADAVALLADGPPVRCDLLAVWSWNDHFAAVAQAIRGVSRAYGTE